MSNPLLELRLANLQESLDKLALTTDENLRSILIGLTCDKTQNQPALTDISNLARAARESCFSLVTREHPMANDLKYAMAVLRVGHDYERIYELCAALFKRVDQLRGTPMQEIMQDMTGSMADILKLHEIIRKTWQRDRTDNKLSNLKAQVEPIASTINTRLGQIQNKIMEVIGHGGGSAEMFVELVLACRHVKRIAYLLEAIPDELRAFDHTTA